MVETIPKKIHQILFLICKIYTLWYTCHMNEEIIHRLFQTVLYTGGIVAFWQITKHMPKVFFNILEFLIVTPFYLLWMFPIAGVIEYVLGGNFDMTFNFFGCLCGVSFMSLLWLVLATLSRVKTSSHK